MSSAVPQPVVLLVEDSDDDAFFFTRALRQAGFTGAFVHVTDGAAAVATLESALRGEGPGIPDLVFLDLKIPHLNGFEVLRWIKAQPPLQTLDVAVLSGSEHAGDVERALALGATAYYVKPILVQQLKSRLAAWQEKTAGIAPATTVLPADTTLGAS